MGNEEKLALGHTLAEVSNCMPNGILTDCEAYGMVDGCDEVCPIDTLEEKESASEELEEAAKKHAKCQREDDLECGYDLTKLESFIAGAQWREDQMMKKAVDADCFGFHGAALFSFRLPSGNYLVGSKVKVIVIKQD